MILYYNYVSNEALEGFSRYKYSCKDTNPLSVYVLHPFWNKVVLLYPKWVAPNLLTLLGFICGVTAYLIPAALDYTFISSSSLETNTISPLAWISVAILFFLAHTLDGTDGKQARRTGSSSPVGELFDHGCDSWSTVFMTCTFFSVFGVDTNGQSISYIQMYLVLWITFIAFHISHWEKYNTGVMYLPWGYDIAMVSGSLIFLMVGIFGAQLFKLSLFGINSSMLFMGIYFSGAFFFTIPVAVMNIRQSYKDGTGKMRPLLENLRPLYPFMTLAVLCFTWAFLSPNDVIEEDPRCFFFFTGTIYSSIACHLIVAQMSGTRCEAFNWLFVPLGAAVGTCILVPGLPLLGELSVLYILTAIVTCAHLHYGVCLLIQLCDYLKIKCFKVTARKDEVTLSKLMNGSNGDAHGDRERLLSDQDLEVVISGSATKRRDFNTSGNGSSSLLVSDDDDEIANVHVI